MLDWHIWNRKNQIADRLKVKTNIVWTGAYGRVNSYVADHLKLKNSITWWYIYKIGLCGNYANDFSNTCMLDKPLQRLQ